MIIRNIRRTRGDYILSLNRERITWISIAAAFLLFFAFFVGIVVGRWSVGEAETVVVHSGSSSEPAPEASSIEAPAAPEPVAPEPAVEPPSSPPVAVPTPPPAPAPSPEPSGRRYAIVAASVPIGDSPVRAREEAEKRLSALRTKGFTSARMERVTIGTRGEYYRIIAREAVYPSAAVGRRDIQSMIRRGELSSAFLLPLEENR